MSKLFLGLSGWDWLEIISLVLVFFGAAFALFLRSKKSKISPDKNGLIPVVLFFKKERIESKKTNWELFWELILVFGLVGEVFSAIHGISEIARLNKEAGESIELASKIGTTNAQLVSSNLLISIELEKLRHPRIIMPDQREKFIEILSEGHNVSKTRIEVIVGNNDRETERFAFQVRKVLDEAGYGDAPSQYQLPLAQMADNSLNVASELPHIDLPAFEWNDAKLEKIPNLRVFPLQVGVYPRFGIVNTTDKNTALFTETPFTDSEPEVIALFSGTNPPTIITPSVNVAYPTENNPSRGVSYIYAATKDTNAILYGVCAVFHEIGITVGENTTTGILPPGHVAFFIPSQ